MQSVTCKFFRRTRPEFANDFTKSFLKIFIARNASENLLQVGIKSPVSAIWFRFSNNRHVAVQWKMLLNFVSPQALGFVQQKMHAFHATFALRAPPALHRQNAHNSL